jgi:hypothetical protein
MDLRRHAGHTAFICVSHLTTPPPPHTHTHPHPHPTLPRYQDYQAADIPVVQDSSTRSRVRVMAGSYAGVTGPISMVNPGLLMDVVLQPGGSVRLEVPHDWTSFAYVYDGAWLRVDERWLHTPAWLSAFTLCPGCCHYCAGNTPIVTMC